MPGNYKSCNGTGAALLKCIVAALALVTLCAGTANQSIASTKSDIQRLVLEEAMNSQVPASLVLAVAKVESDFQENALSPAGAVGVMQLMPAIAVSRYGIKLEELWGARLNVQLGIDFLETLIERYNGRWDLALSHYKFGTVKASTKKLEAVSASQTYVDAVLNWQRRYESELLNAFSQNISQTLLEFPLDGRLTLYPSKNLATQKPPGFSSPDRWLHATWRELDDFNERLNIRVIEASEKLDDFPMLETDNEL